MIPRTSQAQGKLPMLRKTGGSTGMGVSAQAGPATAVVQGGRPWAATGSMAVDDLVVWALVVQRAGNAMAGLSEVEAAAAGFDPYSRTMLAVVEQIAQLGCRIDVSSGQRDATHPVADAVAAAIEALDDDGAVKHAARWGPPNGWAAPARWLVPERWEKEGVAMWCYAEKRLGAHCPLVRVADADTVAAGRAAYLAWWDALMMLAWTLAGKALGFIVLPPSVAREPWLDSR